MSLRDIVRNDFEEFIRLDPSVPEELRNSLRVTERIPKAVDNLAKQLEEAEKHGIIFTREKLKDTVYSMTAQFVHYLKVLANESIMSEAAKTTQIKEIEGDEISKKFDDQGNADLSEELGVIITDVKPAPSKH